MHLRRSLGPLGLFFAAALVGAGCGDPEAGSEPEPIDGASVWLDSCSNCHGAYGGGSEVGPDLRYEVGPLNYDGVLTTILDGKGSMDPIELSTEEAEAVARFVIDELL